VGAAVDGAVELFEEKGCTALGDDEAVAAPVEGSRDPGGRERRHVRERRDTDPGHGRLGPARHDGVTAA
jgi:hypothetical protein